MAKLNYAQRVRKASRGVFTKKEEKKFSEAVESFRKKFLKSGLSEEATEKILTLMEERLGLLNEFQEIQFRSSDSSREKDIYWAFGKALVERGGLTPGLQVLDEIAEYVDEKLNVGLGEKLYLQLLYRDSMDAEQLMEELQEKLDTGTSNNKGVKKFNSQEAIKKQEENLGISSEKSSRVQNDRGQKKKGKLSSAKGEKVSGNIRSVKEYLQRRDSEKKAQQERRQSAPDMPMEAFEEEENEEAA